MNFIGFESNLNSKLTLQPQTTFQLRKSQKNVCKDGDPWKWNDHMFITRQYGCTGCPICTVQSGETVAHTIITHTFQDVIIAVKNWVINRTEVPFIIVFLFDPTLIVLSMFPAFTKRKMSVFPFGQYMLCPLAFNPRVSLLSHINLWSFDHFGCTDIGNSNSYFLFFNYIL